MRVLAKTVVAGGVKYSAGTPATPGLLELIHERHWTTEDQASPAPAGAALSEIDDLKKALAAAGEQRDADTATIAKQYETIARLTGEVETLTQKLAELGLTPAAPAASGVAEPPRAGRGSSEDAWREYATGLGIDVPNDAGRDDIIALVDAQAQG